MRKGENMTLKNLALAFVAVAAMAINAVAESDWTGEPDYYVEYIQSTGAQYIDTGVNAASPLEADMVMMWDAIPADGSFLAARLTGGSRLYALHHYNNWTIGYGNYYNSPRNVSQAMTRKKYQIHTQLANGSQTMLIDGVTAFDNKAEDDYDLQKNLYLFCANNSGTAAYYVSAKCYALKIWQGGELRRDFVPCVKNGEPCLYDKESGEYFRNKTATPLIAGPRVSVGDIPAIPFDGINPVCPDPVIRDLSTGVVLRRGTDYTLEYENNMSGGTATMIIVGMGRYDGMRDRVDFTILSALYVSPDADDSADEDCSSWEKAGTLAKACSLVSDGTASKPSVIMLWSGTAENPAVFDYSKVVKGEDQHTLAIVGKNYVTIRSMDLNPTNCIVRGGGSAQDLRCLQVKDNSHIEGITFEGFGKTGHSTGSEGISLGFGAAIWAARGTAISNCIFRANFGADVGAVYYGDVTACAFICNTNEQASGWHVGAGALYTRGTVRDSYFFGNRSGVGSGALSFYYQEWSKADNCLFVSNAGAYASYVFGPSTQPILTNCVYRENQCPAAYAGTLYKCELIGNIHAGGSTSDSVGAAGADSVVAYDCFFKDNVATATDKGGGAHVKGGTYYRCVFEGGSSTKQANSCIFSGGNSAVNGFKLYDCIIRNADYPNTAIYRGFIMDGCVISNVTFGGVLSLSYEAEMRNTVIAGNVCSNTLLTAGERTAVVNCLIVGNRSEQADPNCLIKSGTYLNCTIADNVCGTWDGGNPAVAAACVCSNTVIYGNGKYDLEGGAGKLRYCAWGTAANSTPPSDASNRQLEKNPFDMTVDEKHPWGFKPRRGSSGLVDKGFSDAAYRTWIPFDLADDPRVFGKAIDIGCYEWQGPYPGLMLLLW